MIPVLFAGHDSTRESGQKVFLTLAGQVVSSQKVFDVSQIGLRRGRRLFNRTGALVDLPAPTWLAKTDSTREEPRKTTIFETKLWTRYPTLACCVHWSNMPRACRCVCFVFYACCAGESLALFFPLCSLRVLSCAPPCMFGVLCVQCAVYVISFVACVVLSAVCVVPLSGHKSNDCS